MAGGAVQLCQQYETALGEEGVVVFWEVELIEGVNVGVVQRWCLKRVRAGRTVSEE